MADWASFNASGEKKAEWADFGGFETASGGPSSAPAPAQGTGGSQPTAQQSGSGLYNVAPPPSNMHRRTSSKGSHDRSQLLTNVNSQLQQYKQRMQLLHQQLIVGQQKMKELQGQQPPQPQLVAQYQRKLQQGIQQYRQLEAAVKQLTQQSQQLQQQAGGQRAGQSPAAPPLGSSTMPRTASQSSGTPSSSSQENVFAAFDEPQQTQSKVEAPLQATPPQTVPMQTEAAATEDDPFASFVEEDSKDKSQPSAEGIAMDMFGAPTGGSGFGTEQQPTILPEPSPAPAPAPPPAPAPVADTANTEETQKLTQKVSKLQDELSLAEREKLKVQQDHETLKRSNADLERQVHEWQLALEEAEERYSDLQSKHQTELEGVRKAGHDTLAVIVEEYKEQSRLSMQQEQERSRSLLASSLQQEVGKWEGLLQEKEGHLTAALEEGQAKAMEKTEQAIKELQEKELMTLEEAIAVNSKKQEKALQEALEAEREVSRKAIAEALEEERSRTAGLLAELKRTHAEELEAERERGAMAAKEAAKGEREQAQELIKEALRKEAERFEGKLQLALDRVRERAEQRLGEELRMADVRRQRSLASVDLFLKSAMTQLQVLLTESPKDTPTGAASVQDTLTENS